MVDASSGGILMRKSPEEGHELIEKIATNHYQWSNNCHLARRTVCSEFGSLFSHHCMLCKYIKALIVTFVGPIIQTMHLKRGINLLQT